MPESVSAIIPFVLIALVFWLLIVRPQRKRAQDLASTQSALGPGVEVMLGSGIYGTVVGSAQGETLELEVAPGTRLTVARQAVVKVVQPGTSDADRALDHEDPAAEQE